MILLHKQATTTPKERAAIQRSDEVAMVLAESFGQTAQTIYKWRNRDSVANPSHTPHRLQTTLTPAHKAVASALRQPLATLLAPADARLGLHLQFHKALAGKADHLA